MSDYEEERNIFETKIKTIRELITDTIGYDYDKLIGDLNMEKGLCIEKIKKKKIEIKLEKLKVSKIIADTIKKSVISEK